MSDSKTAEDILLEKKIATGEYNVKVISEPPGGDGMITRIASALGYSQN